MELHLSAMENGEMTMGPVLLARLVVDGGGSLTMEPWGLRVTCMMLTKRW